MKPGSYVDRTSFFKSETQIQKLFPHMQNPKMLDNQEKAEIINKIMQQKNEIKILEQLVNQS